MRPSEMRRNLLSLGPIIAFKDIGWYSVLRYDPVHLWADEARALIVHALHATRGLRTLMVMLHSHSLSWPITSRSLRLALILVPSSILFVADFKEEWIICWWQGWLLEPFICSRQVGSLFKEWIYVWWIIQEVLNVLARVFWFLFIFLRH